MNKAHMDQVEDVKYVLSCAGLGIEPPKADGIVFEEDADNRPISSQTDAARTYC
jgi:hypothetical protein